MNQDTKAKFAEILAAQLAKAPKASPLPEVKPQPVQELSNLTIDDLLNPSPVYCTPVTFELLKETREEEKSRIIREETVKILADEVSEAKAGGLELVNYSDRAVALFGNTKAVKEQLKALGGRFNPYLNYNGGKVAGWIFSKSREREIRERFSL